MASSGMVQLVMWGGPKLNVSKSCNEKVGHAWEPSFFSKADNMQCQPGRRFATVEGLDLPCHLDTVNASQGGLVNTTCSNKALC